MKRAIVCKRARRTRRRRKVDSAQSGMGERRGVKPVWPAGAKSALVWSLSAYAVVFYVEGLPSASIQTWQWLNGSLSHWACLIEGTQLVPWRHQGPWNPDAACTFVVLHASILGLP
jgi:hypothetical protein